MLFIVILLTNEHQLNYLNFQAHRQVLPGGGGAAGVATKLKLFQKKCYIVKGGGSLLCKTTKISQKQYTNIHHI